MSTPHALPPMAWPTLARTAGRLPGSRFRDDLARQATGNALDADGLLEHARSGRVGSAADFDARGLAWFGHLIASEHESPTHVTDTVALFRLAYRVGGRRAMSKDLDTVWVQALALAGELDRFATAMRGNRANPSAWWAAAADAVHPGEVSASDTEWLEAFNRPLAAAGLEPLTFTDAPGVAFDRVACRAEPVVEPDGPLVSVVVPVYNPGPSLRTTVRSLLAQTWTNLEVLLCDDASTDGIALFDELVASDGRVRHVRAPINGGAYAARNMGIGQARGEFVTFNDADDWSHPRRIERQLAAIRETDGVRAAMSWCIQVAGDMRLTVMGRPPERVNLSSILMDRVDVLSRMGGFDTIRKGADSEFVERFRVCFGAESLLEMTDPLALVQLTTGSLSRDDFRFLRTNPARLQFMSDFRHWHAQLSAAPDDCYLAPGTRGPFPVAGYLRGAPAETIDLDVVVLANLTTGAPTVVDLAAEVTALTTAGLRVGVVEALGPFDLTRSVRQPTGALAQAIQQGVRRVLPGEDVRARLLVVRDPEAVTAMAEQALSGVRSEQALVVADQAPAGRYDPLDVAATLTARAQASTTRWLPATAEIASAIGSLAPSALLQPPAVFATMTPGPRRAAPAPGAPRVGVATWDTTPAATAKRLATVLAPLGERDARLLSWGPTRINGDPTGRVAHLRSGAADEADFVRSVDVVLVPALTERGPHLSPLVAHALREGRVLLVPPQHREHLGDAALYLDETDLATVLDEWGAPWLEAQRERAAGWAHSHLGDDAVLDAILPLLTPPHEIGEA